MPDQDAVRINARLSIPLSELEFRFSPSSGPGGQHASRSATRVTLRFDVARSPSLSEAQRQQLLTGLARRLTRDGVLVIEVQESRRQSRNRQLAIQRLRGLLASALRQRRRRRPTSPSRGARERRLAAKRRRSQIKRRRRWRPEEE